jgi:fructooligosaccharide transport system substrate-binding protein
MKAGLTCSCQVQNYGEIKMKQYKTVIALISIIIIVISCTFQTSSCMGPGTDYWPTTQPSSTTKPQIITFWRPQAHEPENQYYKTTVDRFNQLNKGKIQINMEVISRGNSFAYEDRIYAALASNVLPDLISLDGPNVANYATLKMIIPLDSYFSQADIADFVPGIISQGTYHNALYAIGQSESSVVLFYNRKILQAHDIEPPQSLDQAWTWDDWYSVMKTCSDQSIMGTNMISDQGEWMTYAFEQFWISNGTDIVSKDGTTAQGYINGSKGVEAASFLARLARQGLFSIDPSPTEFEEGKSATKLGGPWNIPGFSNFPDLDWGVTYFPRKAGGIQTAPSGNWALAITTNCKIPETAATVLKYLTNSENGINLSHAIAMPPARMSAYQDLSEYDTLPLRIIKEQVTLVAHARPITPAYPVLTQKFSEALIHIMRGADIQITLDDVANTYDREFAAIMNQQ